MTARRTQSAEDYAAATVNEQAAIARAKAVFDQHASDVATERLDATLMMIDILIASRRIEVVDAEWILPAMGYEVDVPLGRVQADEEDDDDD